MGNFSKIESSYLSKDGCRMVWQGADESDQDVVVLGKSELDHLSEILSKDSTGKIDLQDGFSRIMIHTDTVQFSLRDHKTLEVETPLLKKSLLDFRQIPYESKPVKIYPKEFFPSIQIEKGGSGNKLLDQILSKHKESDISDLFRVMSTRRSTRNFDNGRSVEDWKVEKILAAADTAPTAGNFQGFEVFYVKNKEIKKMLVEAANRQPYVNAPIVLVFCIDPSRVKMNFPPDVLAKFSLQDATLAAAYSQLAASALGLSSIWIGMINEEEVKKILRTDLKPSSILCIGYPSQKRPPKSRRKLKDLIHIIE
ncbi:MAG TPA: nitroreductase family protein [Candidatus Nitrosotenuis sp.]|nr:nitroreductase family protein [Candidatus Nitrosotenuis sp.]